MKLLVNYIRSKWMSLKDELKINLIYPEKFPQSELKSILPASVEKNTLRGVRIGKNVHISGDMKFIGNHVYIGWNTEIDQCVSIGPYSSISHGVRVGLTNHALDHIGTSPLFYAKRRNWVTEDTFNEEDENYVEIGADVLISANVLVLKGVKIGTGAVIGAGSVITKDIPPYAIVAGAPAKIIKYRFEESVINRLLKSEWWKLDEEKIKSRNKYFNNVELFLTDLGF